MNTKYKNSWIKALRSGKFKQGIGVLRDYDTNTFCALGVLCHISGVPLVYNTQTKEIRYDKQLTSLSPRLLTEFQIDGETHDKLTGMNDLDKNFKQIADWIEEHL